MKETCPKLFDRYLRSHRKYGRGDGKPLQMALVLGGAKPATSFNPPSELFSEIPSVSIHSPEQLAEEWDLSYRKRPDSSGLMVSPSSYWLDLLPTVKIDKDAYDRRLGLVYGYPLADINSFLETEGSAFTPLKYVHQGMFSADEVAYLPFTFYRPENSESGYKRAIEIGKKHYNRIHELSRTWDLPTLATMAEDWYRSSIETYSPDEYPPEKLNEMLSCC